MMALFSDVSSGCGFVDGMRSSMGLEAIFMSRRRRRGDSLERASFNLLLNALIRRRARAVQRGARRRPVPKAGEGQDRKPLQL